MLAEKGLFMNKLGLLSPSLGRLSGFKLQLLHSRTQMKWRVNALKPCLLMYSRYTNIHMRCNVKQAR